MSREKKTVGIGAVASVLLRMLHPSAAIRERYNNVDHGTRLEGLLVIRREKRIVNNRNQMTIVMRHDNFAGLELYCVERFVRVEMEGAPEHFFNAIAPIDNEEEEAINEEQRIPDNVVPFLGVDRVDATDAIRLAAVLATDDDDEPAPENIPQADQPPLPQGTWGHNNTYDSKATGVPNACASVCI